MKKILVLEDESNIRSFVVINLRRSGYEPIEAENGMMALEKLKVNDEILVEAYGQGLKIEECPEITVQSLDPDLLESMNIEVNEQGEMTLPVAAAIPSYLMGSGLGAGHSYSGDYDLMTADSEAVKENGLQNLRFGDIVLIEDSDNTFGRGYLTGAVSIGVVIHGDCILMGHGPGVSTLLTAKTPVIEGRLDPHANLADLMGISD
mgnify:CR=1 FL=1